MLVRYTTYAESFILPVYTGKNPFTDDANIGQYAKEYVYTLQKATVVKGYDGNYFYPTNYVTRAEASKMISTENGLLVADGFCKENLKQGLVRGSLGIPMFYTFHSKLMQEYRITSKSITFYRVNNYVYIDDVVQQGHQVFMLAGDYSGKTPILRNGNVVQNRILNVREPNYGSFHNVYDTKSHLVAYKFKTKGNYNVTGSGVISLSTDEGSTGGLNLEHSLSFTF